MNMHYFDLTSLLLHIDLNRLTISPSHQCRDLPNGHFQSFKYHLTTAEDVAWLRKKNDKAHINVAELDATMKGINLALKWGLQAVEIRTDSATVALSIKSEVSGDRRIKTKGAAEMLIKHRLGELGDIIREFRLKITVTLVQSQMNKADMLTRVKKVWLQEKKIKLSCAV